MTKLLARYRAYRAEMTRQRAILAEIQPPSYLDILDRAR